MVSLPGQPPISGEGKSFCLLEWAGSGPDYMHVHHEDDEGWHVLSGSLIFSFEGETVAAPAGSTVFVPAGVVHTYRAEPEDSRYLIVLTPRLNELIRELQRTPYKDHPEVMKAYRSEIV
jgi:mannose-6-phosphate isomerase-like protein (cupin superfamily)